MFRADVHDRIKISTYLLLWHFTGKCLDWLYSKLWIRSLGDNLGFFNSKNLALMPLKVFFPVKFSLIITNIILFYFTPFDWTGLLFLSYYRRRSWRWWWLYKFYSFFNYIILKMAVTILHQKLYTNPRLSLSNYLTNIFLFTWRNDKWLLKEISGRWKS